MEQVGVGGRSLNDQLLQGPAHPADGLQPGGGVDDQLGHQGVVVGGQLVAGIEAGVHPHAVAAGQVEEADAAGTGLEPLGRVLGVDAALDGVAAEQDLLLGDREGEPGGNADLLPHQVQAGNQLGDRVLHLDAGVHFDEVELAVGGQHELDGAGIDVARGPGGRHGRRAHPLPQLRGQGLGGGLLQQLLVAPLDGAVPVAQLDHVPLPVGHDLELDVAGVDDQLLQVHLPAAEAGQRLAAGLFKQGDELFRLIHPAHPPASTAGGGLDEHRVSNGVGQGLGLLGGVYRPVGAGHHRHPSALHQLPGGGLVAHGADYVAGGADEGDAGGLAGVGKVGVLTEKAVAGVDGVAPGGLGHGEDGIDV